MIDSFKKYTTNGFSCLPTKKDKSPLLPKSWQGGFIESEFEGSFGIGVICGTKSDGLECLDFDNHFDDAKDILSDYISIPEVNAIYEKYKLPIEQTMNGGYHLLFRCTKNEGNRKLAQRLNDKKRPEALIETRGEGGYFVAYPTPKYIIRKHDIFNVATITEVDRAILIDSAISLNEYVPVVKSVFESGDRPGDLYNQDIASIDEMKSILISDGWVNTMGYKWRRPDKKEGISATLGKVAPNVFYVFSSSAAPFEPMSAYTPFQVLALLKFNGNFSDAASSVVPEKQEVLENIGELDKILNGAKIDTKKYIEKPPTILSIKEVSTSDVTYKRLFTLGNFSCIIGKAKTKKTFLMTMLASSLVDKDNSGRLVGSLPSGKKEILYFDTEQGEYDCYNTIKRIERMTGIVGRIKGFSLRQYAPEVRCQIIEYAFEKYGDNIAFCAIDGIADLANAINSEDESTRVSTMLLRLTKVHNCHICTVIHQNKNDNFATGHLGSSIMKKAELLISVAKTSDPAVVEVSCDLSRGIDFESFGMSVENGIPYIGELEEQEEQEFYNKNYDHEKSEGDNPPEEIPF